MKLISYLKETRSEMRHVSWPTRAQAIAFTVIVIIISLITAAFLGVFDVIFTELMGTLIK
tara:strand:- start:601 stop:780 length:180 start_codon:yes stop_codon:yes gene_type:complete